MNYLLIAFKYMKIILVNQIKYITIVIQYQNSHAYHTTLDFKTY